MYVCKACMHDTHTNKHTVMSGECDIDASDAEVRSARFHVLLACMYVCMCAYMALKDGTVLGVYTWQQRTDTWIQWTSCCHSVQVIHMRAR